MTEYRGISLWDAGVIAGTILKIDGYAGKTKNKILPAFAAEAEAFLYAKEEVIKRLETLYDHAFRLVSEEGAAIFAAQKMILQDEQFCEEILQLTRNDKTAVEAIYEVTDKWVALLQKNGEDSVIGERAGDVLGLARELASVLTEDGNQNYAKTLEEPVVLVTADLSPNVLMSYPRDKILGIVMQSKAVHSHVAILAKSMRIPTIMGCDMKLSDLENGGKCILDLKSGTFVWNPTDTLIKAAQKKNSQSGRRVKSKQKEAFLNSGIAIFANINSPEELTENVVREFLGVGLFRTEFLYMNRNGYPTEDEQYNSYKAALQRLNGKKLIIRTTDLGDDKGADYLNLPQEKNPALGYRGIRFCLDRPEIFKIQMKAILRAAVYGEIGMLLPMITSLEEVILVKEIMDEASKELEEKKMPYQMPSIGIMIETPAAVMISEELAEYADFFSIGTNDLAQYTLAADRQNTVEYMNQVYNPHHPAVLKLIKMTVENAHKKGIKACICGEMGADLSLIDWFCEIGVDSLSVAPVLFME